MKKITRLYLLFAAASLAATPLTATRARASVGDIYETNLGMVLRIHPSGGTPITFAQGLSSPKGVVFDSRGQLYVADASRGTVNIYTTPDGNGAVFASGFSSPVALTFDALGNLFVGEAGSGKVIKLALDGTRSTFASGLGQPAGLAFAGNGDLFVADFGGGKIDRVTPDGTSSTFASGLSLPSGLAFNSMGNLFEADSGTGTIFKFAPDGTKTSFATGLSRPYGLVFEVSGSLIVSDNGNGSTFRISATGVRSTVFSSDFNTPQFVTIEPATHQLLNVSTRGFVQGGEHVLIAGFIIGGIGPVGTSIVVRALGPSLAAAGVTDPLPDPLLGIRDANGEVVAFNDNWQDAPLGQRVGGSLAPTDDLEAALQLTLGGGSYTAIVTTTDGQPGTALVEVYNLQ